MSHCWSLQVTRQCRPSEQLGKRFGVLMTDQDLGPWRKDFAHFWVICDGGAMIWVNEGFKGGRLQPNTVLKKKVLVGSILGFGS